MQIAGWSVERRSLEAEWVTGRSSQSNHGLSLVHPSRDDQRQLELAKYEDSDTT